MSGLAPVLNLARLVFYRWAREEMNPLHPDLPYVIHRINQLERNQ